LFNISIIVCYLKYEGLSVTGKEVIKILEKHGWQMLRVSGSHHRMGKGHLRTTVPIHGKRDLGKGLISTIEKQTGVKLK
jgi:predicted RNA binding protein YcfA (HicA-like mRNA interferase family)